MTINLLLINSAISGSNKRKHSLPLVAGTPKTLPLFVRPCCGRYNFGAVQHMKKLIACVLSMIILAGCTAGPSAKSYTGPTGEQMATVRCTKETSPCFEKASETCGGGTYRVVSSYRNAGGVLADALPGPVTWYTMSIVCGEPDGVMPVFPLRGSEPAMPPAPSVEKTQCTQYGNAVNCTTY